MAIHQATPLPTNNFASTGHKYLPAGATGPSTPIVPVPGVTAPASAPTNTPAYAGALTPAMQAARAQYGVQGQTVAPNNPNTVNNTTAANNPFSVQQFQQMYAQNPTIALKMYNMDQAAGGRSAINTAMGWGNQANGETPGASNFIKTYSAGGNPGSWNPNAGFTPGGQMYSFSPGKNSGVNEGSLQKFLATGSSKLYGSNPANIPGLTMYGNMNANPQSYAGQFQSSQPSTNMSNLNSNVGANGPYGTGYTGFGNSVEAGPSPTGPTNLPTGPGVGATGNTGSSSNGVSSGTPNYSTGPDNPAVPTAAWTPPPATPAGTPMGGPGTASIGGGVPSVGPAPTPTPTPSNAGGGYAGTNISNSNYNNRFGTSARPV